MDVTAAQICRGNDHSVLKDTLGSKTSEMIPKLYCSVVLDNGGLFLSRGEFTKPYEHNESSCCMERRQTCVLVIFSNSAGAPQVLKRLFEIL
jgi:hypothetical protein